MAGGSVGVLRRFRSLIQSWPVDSTRKGRDLGEYLRNVYSLKIKETVERNVRVNCFYVVKVYCSVHVNTHNYTGCGQCYV